MSLPPPPDVLHCYRHATREVGRRCTRCGNPACSDCLVQASVGSHCLDCAKAARPDLKTRATFWNAGQTTLVTNVLIAINVAVFIYTALGGGDAVIFGSNARTTDLGLSKLFLTGIPGSGYDGGEWYRLLTSGFTHFGLIHIGMNMLALYQLGQLLERSLGRWRFLGLYMAGLFGGSLGSLLLERNEFRVTAGASGAIFGLLAAAAIGMHRRGGNVLSSGIGGALLINLFITFSIPYISIGGHLGGAAAGVVCGYFMFSPAWRPMPTWVINWTPAVVIVTSIALSVVVAQA